VTAGGMETHLGPISAACWLSSQALRLSLLLGPSLVITVAFSKTGNSMCITLLHGTLRYVRCSYVLRLSSRNRSQRQLTPRHILDQARHLDRSTTPLSKYQTSTCLRQLRVLLHVVQLPPTNYYPLQY
jgi:hypothetical protein